MPEPLTRERARRARTEQLSSPRVESTAPQSGSPWVLRRGATVVPDGVRFELWASRPRTVSVMVHSGSAAGVHPLQRTSEHGVWATSVPGMRAGDDYSFVLDDGRQRPDPVSRWQPQSVHGASRVVDPAAFAWTDGEWRGLEMPELVLYELHVGAFSSAGTFDGVISRLGELKALGITAIELMPVAQFPGTRNWGYDGVDFFAPQHSYGGPDGLKRLVDSAHAQGLAVVLDVVYNHLGPEGNYLPEFGPYESESYRSPWGTPLNYDGPYSDEVRRFFIDNALYWVNEYHMDGLRLDATDRIHDQSAQHFLEELSGAVHAEANRLGRSVLVVAETDLNAPRWIRPRSEGGYGLDGQWNDDFHHALHTALTGERQGYYQDFDGVPSFARALTHRYVQDGVYSAYRQRRRGAPALDRPRSQFVVFAQNHDQVGNRRESDRLAATLTFEQCKLAAAALLLSPYVPLIFMGEEYGETNPFLFFVQHGDPQLVAGVREGRRKEFEAHGWMEAIPDPLSEDVFHRSRLDWSRRTEPRNAALLALHRDLIALRTRELALRPDAADVAVMHDADAKWIAMRLTPPRGNELLVGMNFGGENVVVIEPGERVRGGGWTELLSTSDPRYSGDAAPAQRPGHPERRPGNPHLLPPHAAIIWSATR